MTDEKFLEENLGAFVAEAWHVLEPATPFVRGWHIDAIAEHLQAVTNQHIRNLLINVPPRHGKSLIVSVFWPTWEWVSHPHRRWLFSAYALSLSIRDSLRCRRLMASPWFRDRWPDKFHLLKDQNEKFRFDNDKGGYRLATSVGGAATGEGGDRVVVDDPHAIAERQSDACREAALIWWDETMSTRLNDPRSGARVIVMQRLHENDLSSHVLAQGGYHHLCLPAEFEPDRRCVTSLPGFNWSDPRTTAGDLLWPARIGAEQIAEAKLRLGPIGYAGQFQQRPVPAGGARFRSEWFRYFRPVDATTYRLIDSAGMERSVPTSKCNRFAVMDPAGTDKSQNQRACYTVIQVWDIGPAGEMLLVHQFRAQVQTPDAVIAAVRIAKEFDVEFMAIEKDGIGLGVVQSVRNERIAVRPIKARGSKEARSETAEIRMAAGTVYFPRGAPFCFELEQELLHFPNGQYTDQVDALAHAAMLVQRMNKPAPQTTTDEASEKIAAVPLPEPFEQEWEQD